MPKFQVLSSEATKSDKAKAGSVQTSISSYFSSGIRGKSDQNLPSKTSDAKKRKRSADQPSDEVISKKSANASVSNSCQENKHNSQEHTVQLSQKTLAKLSSYSLTTPSISTQGKHSDHITSGATSNQRSIEEVQPFMPFTKPAPSTEADSEPLTSSADSSLKSKEVKKTNKGSSSAKYTPLEQQFMSIKEEYSDAVLFIECGYKYRFFGEDAQIASRELSIYCHMDHNFMTASIPVHRLHVHVRRLVAKGYKVGVVKQTETAALKAAGDNRSALFTRQLSALYTTSTMIGEDLDAVADDAGEAVHQSASNYLVCVRDQKTSEQTAVFSQRTKVAVVAVQPSTGNIIYDEFLDGDDRLELDTRISHIQPVEILFSSDVSPSTKHLLSAYASASNISHFQSQSKELQINAQTLRNLDVYQSNGRKKGSLLWFIDHTKTPFGSRMLSQWLSKPLADAREIEARLSAVSEMVDVKSSLVNRLILVLGKLPDLEKNLGAVLHKKLIEGVLSAAIRHETPEMSVDSDLIKSLLTDTAELLQGVYKWTGYLDESAAREGDKTRIFKDISNWPNLQELKKKIESLHKGLQTHIAEIRRILCEPKMSYTTVLNTEFLVELKNTQLDRVPREWTRVSTTKVVSRFHTPFVEESIQQLNQCKEQLENDSKVAWIQFLSSFEEEYHRYRKAVKNLAVFDCLVSLATVAKHQNFCRPTIESAGSRIEIVQGRHPVVEHMMDGQEQYVPNDTHLETNGERCAILTGPNMGGKSSYIRQVAMIALMAHIGSYVPAERATIGVLDAIYTRMGAYDSLLDKRHSTFMVELSETTDILSKATERSLVIMDELGRGTSTHDGTAIAYATLQHLVQKVKCLCLFVTHYPMITELSIHHPNHVGNYFMSYVLHGNTNDEDAEETYSGEPSLTFLYQCERGVAESSYGLNVARLAGIPPRVITTAALKANELSSSETRDRNLKKSFCKLWNTSCDLTRELLNSS